MKSINLIAVTAVLLISTFVNAQPIFGSSNSEFFIETPQRSKYTVTLGDETIISRNGRFRFFDLPDGRFPVTIALNNRVIFTSDVLVKPGMRTIAVLNRNKLIPLKYLDLERNRLDNWDRVLEDNYHQERPLPGSRYQDNYTSTMSAEAFSRLMKSVRDATFYKDRLAVIDLTVGYSYFTVNQIMQMINLMSFTDEKLEVLRRMYPSVADPQNGFQIMDAFPFTSDKEKVKAVIMSGRNPHTRK